MPPIEQLALMFVPEPPEVLRQLPVTGQLMYLEHVLKVETIDPAGPLISAAATLALSGLFIWLTSRHLGSARSINAL